MRWEWRRLAPAETDHELIWGSVVLVGLAAAVALAWLAIMPVVACPFKGLTGLPCPTCGGTRAALLIVQGRLSDALAMNPVVAAGVLLGGPWSVYAVAASVLGLPRPRVRFSDRVRPCLRPLAVLGLAAWWVAVIALGT